MRTTAQAPAYQPPPPAYQMKPKEEMKTMAMAGTGIINSQIPAAKPYYAPAQATLGVSPTKADQYNS